MKKRLLPLCLALCVLLCGCGVDKKAAFNKGIKAFGEGDYIAAADHFQAAGDYSQSKTYYNYAKGVVYYEQGDYEKARDHFESVQDFMYGKDRYRYSAARVLEQQGNFEGAKALYEKLGEYEDSKQRLAYATGRVAESNQDYEAALYAYMDAGSIENAPVLLDNLQTQIYDRAKQFKSESRFEEALNLFGKLGDYFDSPSQAMECKDFYRDQLYQAAEALLANGNKMEAYQAFLGLSGYSDAEQRSQMLAAELGIKVESYGEDEGTGDEGETDEPVDPDNGEG